MADVGDQFAFHAFRADLVLQRRLHAVTERVNVLGHFSEHALRHIGQLEAEVARTQPAQRVHDTLKTGDAFDEKVTCREEPDRAEHEDKKRAAHSAEHRRKERENNRIRRKEQHNVARFVVAEQHAAQFSETLPDALAYLNKGSPAPEDESNRPALLDEAAVLDYAHKRQRKFECERKRRDEKQDGRYEQYRHVVCAVQQFTHQCQIQSACRAEHRPEAQHVHFHRQTVDGNKVHVLVLRLAPGDEQQIHEQHQCNARQHDHLLEHAGNLRFLRFPLSLDGSSLCVREAHQQQGVRRVRIELIELPAFLCRILLGVVAVTVRFLIVNRKRIAVVHSHVGLHIATRPCDHVKRRIFCRGFGQRVIADRFIAHSAKIVSRKIRMLPAEFRCVHAIFKRIRHFSTHYAELLMHIGRVGKIALKAIDHLVKAIRGKICYRVLNEKQCTCKAPHNACKRDKLYNRTA